MILYHLNLRNDSIAPRIMVGFDPWQQFSMVILQPQKGKPWANCGKPMENLWNTLSSLGKLKGLSGHFLSPSYRHLNGGACHIQLVAMIVKIWSLQGLDMVSRCCFAVQKMDLGLHWLHDWLQNERLMDRDDRLDLWPLSQLQCRVMTRVISSNASQLPQVNSVE